MSLSERVGPLRWDADPVELSETYPDASAGVGTTRPDPKTGALRFVPSQMVLPAFLHPSVEAVVRFGRGVEQLELRPAVEVEGGGHREVARRVAAQLGVEPVAGQSVRDGVSITLRVDGETFRFELRRTG